MQGIGSIHLEIDVYFGMEKFTMRFVRITIQVAIIFGVFVFFLIIEAFHDLIKIAIYLGRAKDQKIEGGFLERNTGFLLAYAINTGP